MIILQCQSAALDELFGKGGECFQRYHTAQILLHSLAQHVSHSQDRALLIKCMFCFRADCQFVKKSENLFFYFESFGKNVLDGSKKYHLFLMIHVICFLTYILKILF